MARDKIERIRRGEVTPASRGAARPFVTIPTTIFATKRIRALPGAAVRVLLWAEAGWHPAHGVVLSQHVAAEALSLRRSTVSNAIKRLIGADLMAIKSPAVKPGNGPGRAAVYDLPHRKTGAVLRFDQGDARLPGLVKAWCDELRETVRGLGDAAARVLLIAAGLPRQSDGTLPDHCAGVDLASGRLARDLPGMTERTARRAVAELVKRGLVQKVEPRVGQPGARFQPAGPLLTRIPRKKVGSRRK